MMILIYVILMIFILWFTFQWCWFSIYYADGFYDFDFKFDKFWPSFWVVLDRIIQINASDFSDILILVEENFRDIYVL